MWKSKFLMNWEKILISKKVLSHNIHPTQPSWWAVWWWWWWPGGRWRRGRSWRPPTSSRPNPRWQGASFWKTPGDSGARALDAGDLFKHAKIIVHNLIDPEQNHGIFGAQGPHRVRIIPWCSCMRRRCCQQLWWQPSPYKPSSDWVTLEVPGLWEGDLMWWGDRRKNRKSLLLYYGMKRLE